MLVTVIIPAYKKEATIKKDVRNVLAVMRNTRWDFEIIVVVDGFIDKTLEKVQELNDPEVSVVGYKTNRGKGYAVRYGMARAKGDPIVFIDAGMEIDANGISILLEHMLWYKADIMVGSKRHPASRVKYTFMRRIYSFGYQLLVFFLFRLKIRDTQAGLKAYRREVLEKVLPRLIVKAFAFDVELLAVSQRLGFSRIFEAPIQISLDFSSDSKFKKSKPLFLDKEIRNMLYDTIAVFYRMHFLKYYDDSNKRKWFFDKELQMRVNTGESQ